MLIDIPVLISFNADNAEQAYRGSRNAIFTSTFTLRLDPLDSDIAPSFRPEYPPRDGAVFWPFEAHSICEFMPHHTEKLLAQLANDSPEDYFVDQQTAMALVDARDQGRDQ